MSTEDSTPWSRLKARFGWLLDPVDPLAPPPPTPPEFTEWTVNVSAVAMLNMVVAAWREHGRLQAEITPPPMHLPPALHGMYARNQQSGHLAKVATRAVKSGAHAFAFAGLFFGLDPVLETLRGEPGWLNTLMSGAATGALYGALLPGSAMFRLSRAALGAGAGGAAGAIVGQLNHSVVPALEQV